VLEVRNVSDGSLLKDISFTLRKGEILGFAGLVGAGRSELVKSIFGLWPIVRGEILVNGKAVSIRNPEDAMRLGLVLVPESRKLEAIYPEMSMMFNITLKTLKEFIKGVFVDSEKERAITREQVETMAIKTPSYSQTVGNLSGGNQQKVVIGRWLATKPRILILDEPTKGVDVGAKAEIYAIMNGLVKQGVSIIMISSELPEVINMADRVMVMSAGRITACLPREKISQEEIMKYATQFIV
jgi:ribose transport system ATP-binding protein